MSEVKAVRNAALNLLQRRNEVAHGAAILQTSRFAPGSDSEYVAGVRLPRSKRKGAPDRNRGELAARTKSWLRTVPEIRGYWGKAIELQAKLARLSEQLNRHKRGKPWMG